MSFYYLASPYSKYPEGIEAAFHHVSQQAALLVKAGIPVYAPIAHTHPIAIHGELDPFDHEIWLEADRTFMETAKGLIVCTLPGWDCSYGISVEIDHFKQARKPIYYMTPFQIPHLPCHLSKSTTQPSSTPLAPSEAPTPKPLATT